MLSAAASIFVPTVPLTAMPSVPPTVPPIVMPMVPPTVPQMVPPTMKPIVKQSMPPTVPQMVQKTVKRTVPPTVKQSAASTMAANKTQNKDKIMPQPSKIPEHILHNMAIRKYEEITSLCLHAAQNGKTSVVLSTPRIIKRRLLQLISGDIRIRKIDKADEVDIWQISWDTPKDTQYARELDIMVKNYKEKLEKLEMEIKNAILNELYDAATQKKNAKYSYPITHNLGVDYNALIVKICGEISMLSGCAHNICIENDILTLTAEKPQFDYADLF